MNVGILPRQLLLEPLDGLFDASTHIARICERVFIDQHKARRLSVDPRPVIPKRAIVAHLGDVPDSKSWPDGIILDLFEALELSNRAHQEVAITLLGLSTSHVKVVPGEAFDQLSHIDVVRMHLILVEVNRDPLFDQTPESHSGHSVNGSQVVSDDLVENSGQIGLITIVLDSDAGNEHRYVLFDSTSPDPVTVNALRPLELGAIQAITNFRRKDTVIQTRVKTNR